MAFVQSMRPQQTLTHAADKAVLFLLAGCLIHFATGEQDVRRFGSLGKRLMFALGGMSGLVLSNAGLDLVLHDHLAGKLFRAHVSVSSFGAAGSEASAAIELHRWCHVLPSS